MATGAVSPQWPPLESGTETYRAYPFPDSFYKGKIIPKLFYRKQGETGLSLFLVEASVKGRMPGSCGHCKLEVGAKFANEQVHGYGILGCPDNLELTQDAYDHAEIKGVPTRDEDTEKALRIAKYLARVAVHVSFQLPAHG